MKRSLIFEYSPLVYPNMVFLNNFFQYDGRKKRKNSLQAGFLRRSNFRFFKYFPFNTFFTNIH